MALRVKPTPTRFPTNSLFLPMDSTALCSMPNACHPWCWCSSRRTFPSTSIFLPMDSTPLPASWSHSHWTLKLKPECMGGGGEKVPFYVPLPTQVAYEEGEEADDEVRGSTHMHTEWGRRRRIKRWMLFFLHDGWKESCHVSKSRLWIYQTALFMQLHEGASFNHPLNYNPFSFSPSLCFKPWHSELADWSQACWLFLTQTLGKMGKLVKPTGNAVHHFEANQLTVKRLKKSDSSKPELFPAKEEFY